MNTVSILGHLTAEPELKKTKNGISVCNVYLAVRGTKEFEIDFIPVQVWRSNAENLCRYMHKGNKIAVAGRLKEVSYIDNNNNVRHSIEVVANEVYYCETTRKKIDDYDPIFDEEHRTKEDWDRIASETDKIEELPF